MTLSRRVAALERAHGPPGVCRCPGSVEVFWARNGPVPPPRACPACRGTVRRIVVHDVPVPRPPDERERPWYPAAN